MRGLPGLFAVILVVGCAGEGAQPNPPLSTTTTTTVVSTSTSLPPATTTTLPSGPPVAWVAPSGVPVAVTAVKGETIEVLTPCGNPAALIQGTPIYDVDVLLDPGHGGPIDTGAVASTGLEEKEVNLEVATAVKEVLDERGISSMLTRTGDYPIPIRTRTAYSDLVGARALVSIHHNAPAAPASEIPGVEIFVQSEAPESARLGGLIYDTTMEALARFDVDWDRAPDAGTMTVINDRGMDTYGMVRLPLAPSVLVELGYIANPAEAELYSHPAYAPTAAQAIADAIETFLTSDQSGAPLVEGRSFTAQRGVGKDVCVEPDLEAPLYHDVVGATVTREGATYDFEVTVTAPHVASARNSDAWRVIGDDGVVYAVSEHEGEPVRGQMATYSLPGVEIPSTVTSVTIQARDVVYGWGGGTVELILPGPRRPTFR